MEKLIKRKGLKLRKKKFKRDAVLYGRTYFLKMGCGDVHIVANETDDGEIIELFIEIGKAGMCQNCMATTLGRVLSISLQDDIDKRRLIKTLKGVQCGGAQPGHTSDEERILSCADGIAKILNGDFKKQELDAARIPVVSVGVGVGVCPDCGGSMMEGEGCSKCLDPGCGYAQC